MTLTTGNTSPSISMMTDSSPIPALNLSELQKGELIWFDPGIEHALPGEVLEFHKATQVLTVQAVIAGKPQIFSLTSPVGVRRRQDLGQNGVEDMIQLSDLNEASLLWNLKIRYEKELIYTYVGSILIAVNPYKMYDMYGLDMVKKYEGQILGTLPPHLFAIGSAAYASLPKSNQVVVISGESGSGKTESTKLVMQYLAAVNKSPSNLVTEQILEASPLLESFGNAKTVRNDNSSRFGKYLEVYFKEGVIVGARVTEYLLEKSRIVTQAADERNYHVFYELLAGLSDEEKLKYGLLSADKYFYLNQGDSCDIDGKSDSEDFQSLLSAMQILGFTSEEQDTIFRILASVLHLGNVYFHRKQLKHGQEGVEIGSDAEIRWTAHLLRLDADGIKQALTTKTTEARNERLFTALNIDQALDARDAFAKALYSSLFTWLVARINQIVYKGHKKTSAISILDIFGFEDFKENSFEQLCINYANENLQFYFNKHIFKLEQQEYAKEKIQWQNITFNDNLPVIHLLSKKPVGILHLLDDESNFPKGTDASFLEKCHYNHALNELYSRPRLNVPEFGVKHFAGSVWYNVDGFLDKNRDTLRTDVVDLLISSSLTMLSKMFAALRDTYETSKTLNKANGRFVTMKPRTPTVAARFHDSLQQLLESMSKCHPWFVRCIKPNSEKMAMKFDMPTVLEQLRYSGMLETIRIRKLGYPVRMKFSEFVDHYRFLLRSKKVTIPRGTPSRELCHVILEKYEGDYQLGTTRIFLRENLERNLEAERVKILHEAAVSIQRNIRSFLARKRFVNMKESAIKLQATFRAYRHRKQYLVMRKGIVKAQAHWRGKQQRKQYQQLKDELKRKAQLQKEKARVKAMKEEQEKTAATSHAVTGVHHLDIPAELAFIFNKLEDSQTVAHGQIVKVVGSVVDKRDTYTLPSDVDQHVFSKFANIYFKSHLWGMKREPIKTPFLHKAKDADFSDSLAIFKLILRFMNDDSLTEKKEQALGNYIAYKGLSNDKLRDEILCQLVNQTWRNDVVPNNERAWLLMATCLSSFPPSGSLYKFLLKYVSDHGYDGYKAICQHKLLQSHNQWSRTYPPSSLEWRSNRKKVNTALQLHLSDGETVIIGVNSWTRCETVCEIALSEKSISECHGWTLSVQGEESRNGLDYVFDIISEMELPTGFPIQKKNLPVTRPSPAEIENPGVNRRPTVPPPEPPTTQQQFVPPKVRSISRDHIAEHVGLSRHSALNDRYFEKQSNTRSRSLDNLLSPVALSAKTEDGQLRFDKFGLSRSRLNERYHSQSQSMEKIQEVNTVTDIDIREEVEFGKTEEDNLESVSQRGGNRKYSITGASSDVLISGTALEFDFPDMSTRSEDDKGNYSKGHSRFVKSHNNGKRSAPGSHSSRAQIETRQLDRVDYSVRSSAMSDTSEAPSLASHVRRVRVPSQASDVDQFLDDLFNPVLDQLSDVRSLAASIKGDSSISSNRRTTDSFDDSSILDSKFLAKKIKGGGQTGGGVGARQTTSSNMQSTSFNFPSVVGPPSPMMPNLVSPSSLLLPSVPLLSPQSLSLSGQTANEASILAYQTNLQQAFLQSAMAQNIQIQQQLLAQNQALQQLLQQQQHRNVPTPDTSPVHHWNNSPPKSKSTPYNSVTTTVTSHHLQVQRSNSPHSHFTNVLTELKSRRSSVESNTKGMSSPPPPPPPPPPPLPPPPELIDPNETRPFMDPYGRAKTVRIGKWRWPPPKDDNASQDTSSFLQFKMKQQRRKHSQESPSGDGEIIEWEEYEVSTEEQLTPQTSPSTQFQHTKSPNRLDEVHRSSYKSLEVGSSRPGPGSIGKLRISNEMKHKLELVTANHSLRSVGKPRPPALSLPSEGPPSAGKLDSERRMLLQQQLSGRWGSVDSIDNGGVAIKDDIPQTSPFHKQQIDRSEKQVPVPGRRRQSPPVPVIPRPMNGPPRSSSFYSQSNTGQGPIQVVTKESYEQKVYSPGSVSTQHIEHVELEESSEFLDSTEPSPVTHASHPQQEALPTTIVYSHSTAPHFTYNKVNWKLQIRKEVFSPKEATSSPLALHLIFCQIVADVLSSKLSIRIAKEEQSEMLQLFDRYDINQDNVYSNQHKIGIKRTVLELAQHWPLYFARIFPVSCGYDYPDVHLLALSHIGVQLLRLDMNKLKILYLIRLEEMAEVTVGKTGNSMKIITLSGDCFPIFAQHHRQMYAMLNAFLREAAPPALAAYNDERNRLHERKGWQIEAKQPAISDQPQVASSEERYPLVHFAIYHFRRSRESGFHMIGDKTGSSEMKRILLDSKRGGAEERTWKELVDLVRYSPVPISESLLYFDDDELNVFAVECFECIMHYMGDIMIPALNEVKCVYTILMHCHKFENLRDEVYCQLMKQTTGNNTASCQRGWRLLSIVAAYFMCSDSLKPFLLKYLESTAYDKRKQFHGTANVCLQNIRKTLRYGGRKNVPSVEEVTAVSAGRNSKRQIYRLPGGGETVINTKSTTVVDDIIREMCVLVNVNNPLETEEFSLYCVVEGDVYTMPLAREEYILDITTEVQKNQQVYYLIFCRSVWYFPLRLDCHLYVQVLFNQIAPDYLEGLLLIMPDEEIVEEQMYEVAKLAALLHRAADMDHVPTMKETKFLLPKPALYQPNIKPAQWVQMVQASWPHVEMLRTIQAKAQFLEILTKWLLFGTSFFCVKRSGDQQILALNKSGVHFLHLYTHETISTVPYSEVISTRKVRAESGVLYLELKCGNLFQQRVARLQTDQAHEISRLIKQYMSLHRRA